MMIPITNTQASEATYCTTPPITTKIGLAVTQMPIRQCGRRPLTIAAIAGSAARMAA